MSIKSLHKLSLASLLLYFLLSPCAGNAVCLKPSATLPGLTELRASDQPEKRLQKPGLFKKMRMLRNLKTQIRHNAPEGETASVTSLVGLGLFYLSFLLLLVNLVGGASAGVGWLLGGVLLGIAISVFVLATEKNKRSRLMAKIVMIWTGISLGLLGLLWVIFINSKIE